MTVTASPAAAAEILVFPTLSPWCENAGRLIAEAIALLEHVSEPANAWIALAVQCRRETANGDPALAPGVVFRNPLNIAAHGGVLTWLGQEGTYGGPSVPHRDSAKFGSVEAGCWACASTYTSRAYSNVIGAFKIGDPVAIARAIQESSWDPEHYGYTLAAEVQHVVGTRRWQSEATRLTRPECV